MGTVLDFANAPRRGHSTALPVPAEGADVVIFPGVRMERLAVDLAARLKALPGEHGLGVTLPSAARPAAKLPAVTLPGATARCRPAGKGHGAKADKAPAVRPRSAQRAAEPDSATDA